MNAWVLDDGPFGDLALQFDRGWTWPADAIHIVHEVALRADVDKSGRRQKLLEMKNAGSPCVRVHRLLVPSPAADMLYDLRPDESDTDKDRGEHASIALCAIEQKEAAFVTNDKRAAYLALCELGPSRVASPFDLWLHLRGQGLITTNQFGALCERSKKSASLNRVPTRIGGQAS